MKLLRDVREATRLLILKEITSRRHSRLRTIADKLDITVQAVSEYMRTMTREGFVRNVDGDWRATRKGVEFLQADFIALREFVESSVKEMSIVDVASAIAGGEIREGDEVGLFMEGGELIARPRAKSSSRGIAVGSASRGEDVGVKDLEGIVRLRPGRVTILRIPSTRDGGTRKIDSEKVLRLVKRHPRAIIASVELTGRVLSRRLKLVPDISFSVLPATLEAAQRGLDVLVLCPEDRVAEFIGGVEDSNSRLEEKITYETVSVR